MISDGIVPSYTYLAESFFSLVCLEPVFRKVAEVVPDGAPIAADAIVDGIRREVFSSTLLRQVESYGFLERVTDCLSQPLVTGVVQL